ncbi:MAG: hypothetical protein JST59_01010 [Actinobacteria bacterium]|nr:hypothetical protein [Actinomycetota bacterium]
MPKDQQGKNRKYKVNRDKADVREDAEDWEKVEEYTKKGGAEEDNQPEE